MKRNAVTFTNKRFHYKGSLGSNIEVFTLNNQGMETGTAIRIDADTIDYVRHLIKKHGDIKMGACRDNPSPNSLGKHLQERKKSPQWLSYLLPLLEEEGYLRHYKLGNAFYVKYANNQ